MNQTGVDGQIVKVLPRRAKRRALMVGSVLGATGIATAYALQLSGGHGSPSVVAQLAASSAPGPVGADQAAIAYVDARYPGTGTAQVIQTEPDTDRGVAVYDIRIQAPDGTIHLLQLRRSDYALLAVTPAESQAPPGPSTPTTAPAPTVPTTSPTSTPGVQNPPAPPTPPGSQPVHAAEPTETVEAVGTAGPTRHRPTARATPRPTRETALTRLTPGAAPVPAGTTADIPGASGQRPNWALRNRATRSGSPDASTRAEP